MFNWKFPLNYIPIYFSSEFNWNKVDGDKIFLALWNSYKNLNYSWCSSTKISLEIWNSVDQGNAKWKLHSGYCKVKMYNGNA
jgi:hypothetical protein